MADDLPESWDEEAYRTYTPADGVGEREYVTYLHESDDVRLRVAPTTLDGGDRPGYSLTATVYPGLDLAESFRVRTVLTFRRCDEVARSFMTLFSSAYDGPATIEDALTFAYERTRAPDANDGPIVLEDDALDDGR